MYSMNLPYELSSSYLIDHNWISMWNKEFSVDGSLLTLELNLAGTKKGDIELSMNDDIVTAKVGNIKHITTVPPKYKQNGASYEDGILSLNFEKKDKTKIIDIL